MLFKFTYIFLKYKNKHNLYKQNKYLNFSYKNFYNLSYMKLKHTGRLFTEPDLTL